MPRVVALFSGGLDSLLAVRILQEQGVEVEALQVRVPFDRRKTAVARAAADLDVPLTVLPVADDYADVIRNPSFGYGKGMNPCIDCRIYMCRMAKRFMEKIRASAVITGEILGQRPMSQLRRHFDIIAASSGLGDRLLRPLSGKLLPPTVPEREGWVDRRKLYAFAGRGRGKLIKLAGQLGIRKIPTPSAGCALAEVSFAPRVHDLIQFDTKATLRDFELLNLGRHFRFDPYTKVVVGRNADDNVLLEHFFQRADASKTAFLHPENFPGPDSLVAGRPGEEVLRFAGELILRYTRQADPKNALVRITQAGKNRIVRICANSATQFALML